MAVSPGLWTVQSAHKAPLATVQLRHYDFPTPHEVIEDEDRPILSFTYPRADGPDGKGRFVPALDTWSDLGAVILRPPGHPLHAYGKGGPSRILICEYDAASFKGLTGLNDWDPARLRRCIDIRSNSISRSIRRVSQELEQPGFGSEMLIESLLRTMLVDLARLFQADAREEDDGAKGGLTGWQLRKIREMLHETTGDWPSVNSLADACGISRCHLSRSFRQATGSTLADYSAMIRILRAKTLLAQQQLPIGEVAKQIGFRSASSFSTAFRRATGLSPASFIRAQGHAGPAVYNRAITGRDMARERILS